MNNELEIFRDPEDGELTTFETLVTKYSNEIGVVNLLSGNGEQTIEGENFEDTIVINSLEGRSLRTIYQIIQRELVDNAINKDKLKGYLDRFNEVISRRGINDEKQLAQVLSAIGAFRYECENKALAYQGTFVLPKKVRELLPNQGIYFGIGMGPGDNIITLANEKNLNGVLGCDISSSMVYRAKREYNRGRFFVGDAQDLPLAEESIDVAIICNALDRIPTARTTIDKIGRLVKPGGYLVVAQCNPFQNQFTDNGLRFVYVPQQQQLNSVDEAIEAAGLNKTYRNDMPFEWNINTLLYGKEKLDVNVAIGQKQ
ncbi:class I SAM-dependent methyltransferase [Candidatus Woesearchaeota archaeon]|nr:class I SAM-dependent methyltransferase [Candidatus Woesearchaeota archaeon]